MKIECIYSTNEIFKWIRLNQIKIIKLFIYTRKITVEKKEIKNSE